MDLKLYLEDTLSFIGDATSEPNTIVNWRVEKDAPLNSKSQINSLAKAVGLNDNINIDTKTLQLIHNNRIVDMSLSPVKAGLMSGSGVSLSSVSIECPPTPRKSHSPMNSSRTHRPRSTSLAESMGINEADRSKIDIPLSNIESEDSVAVTPRGEETVAITEPSEIGDTSLACDTPRIHTDNDKERTEGTQSTDENPNNISQLLLDETYVSKDCGWLPFHIKNNYGQTIPVVSFINPRVPYDQLGEHPAMQDLCSKCSKVVSDTSLLHVSVGRHYKPLCINTDTSEGWVERLSMKTISRWQKRFLTISEKCVNWFAEEPKAGLKTLIKGSRPLICDGICNVISIIDDPDPILFPKCKNPGYLHFGIEFKDPKGPVIFRVKTLQERTKHIRTLKLIIDRISNKGAKKDPVYWKKWSDALLTNISDLGSINYETTVKVNNLRNKLKEVEERRKALAEEKNVLEHVYEINRNKITDTQNRINKVDAQKLKYAIEMQGEKDLVQTEELNLVEFEVTLNDEQRKVEYMKNHAIQEKTKSKERIDTLIKEIEEITKKRKDLFAKWRRHEEKQHNKCKGQKRFGKASQLISFSVDGIPLPQGARTLHPETIKRFSVAPEMLSQSSTFTPADNNPEFHHSDQHEISSSTILNMKNTENNRSNTTFSSPQLFVPGIVEVAESIGLLVSPRLHRSAGREIAIAPAAPLPQASQTLPLSTSSNVEAGGVGGDAVARKINLVSMTPERK